MSKKSLIFSSLFLVFVVTVVLATYFRMFVFKNYEILQEVDCDPSGESCFVWECDPEFEECSGDPAENVFYYKIIRRNAFSFNGCFHEEVCRDRNCLDSGNRCEVIFCDQNQLEEGDRCESPETFEGWPEEAEDSENEIINGETETNEAVEECDVQEL